MTAFITSLLLACKTSPSTPPPQTDDSTSVTAPPTGHTGATSSTTPPSGHTGRADSPAVVLVIGDGMGPAHLEAGSSFVAGAAGALTIQQLPAQGSLRTASLSGITDSAAAGTLLAAGRHTLDGRVALDPRGMELETLFDLAQTRGWATGVVTTSRIPHATIAVFTAHQLDRDAEVDIAGQQIGAADLLLGGGAGWFTPSGSPGSVRDDDGLLDEMAARGVTFITVRSELAAAPIPLIGAFAASHLPYVIDRPVGAASLPELTAAALDKLGDDPEGVLLVVEGARIDHASHGNDAERMVHEVAELDATVALLREWASARGALLVVTADHDCGGLDHVVVGAAGAVPALDWRWGNHSNADVTVSAEGPGSDDLDGADADHRLVHAVLARAIDGRDLTLPRVLVPDGHSGELTWEAASQAATSSLGDDRARLASLRVDGDDFGLAIGVVGVFPWQSHAVVALLDVDGPGSGLSALNGQLTDVSAPVDQAISALRLTAPAGVAFDVATVSLGGVETPYLPPLRGVRGLVHPFGSASSFGELGGALNYSVGSRSTPDDPVSVRDDHGFEMLIPWHALWPSLAGGVPPDAEIAIAVTLSTVDGASLTNQALPSWPAGAADPAPGARLPGVVRFAIDTDGDGAPGPFALR
jgi:alkaline phosphatase